jgi:retinol-binding protein 3
MYRFAWVLAAFAATLAVSASAAFGEVKLDAAVRERAIDRVLKCVVEGYVDPDVARKMEQAVRERVAKEEYAAIADGPALAEKLTQDLRGVSHDLHLRVHYSSDVLPPEPGEPHQPSATELDEMRRAMTRENFGLVRAEVLKGNIGYLDFRYFVAPEMAADTYSGAMGVVANTDALILDLRRNQGSMSMDAIPMLCSYFFASPVHLIDIRWRHEGSTRQLWTWAHVPGKRYIDKPIYVLTSGQTFSGAEELAYDLKNLKRATLIGETTGGGANGGGTRRADDHFMVWVPSARVTSPITGTNWEGTGVTPHVSVPAARALQMAHLTALRESVKTASDEPWKQVLNGTISELEQSAPRLKRVTFQLKGHPDAREVRVAGSFNYWSIRSTPMIRKGDAWVGQVDLEPGRHAYKFVVDGQWITDPANPDTTKDGEHTNSALVVQ